MLGGPGAVPFMIMGADVTHPTGASAREDIRDPSVAAVVASLDQTLGRWSSRVLLQTGRQEMISGMATATRELLMEFYRANRCVRDGLRRDTREQWMRTRRGERGGRPWPVGVLRPAGEAHVRRIHGHDVLQLVGRRLGAHVVKLRLITRNGRLPPRPTLYLIVSGVTDG